MLCVLVQCGLAEEAEKRPYFYVWKFICPAYSTFNFNLQFHFYQAESIPSLFWKSFLTFSLPASHILFLTSHFLTLLLSSHHTDGSSLFNLISYTLQFRPCFSFTAAFCLHKTWKKCNSALLLQSCSALIFKYKTPLGRFPQNNLHKSRDILVPFHTMLVIIHCNLKCFPTYFFPLWFWNNSLI